MLINTGRAVRKSGARGGAKRMIYAELDRQVDNRNRVAYDACKYLPHQGDREKARRRHG